MASYTCQDYFLARVPDFNTIVPGYPLAVAIQSAIALYWDRFITTTPLPDIDETLLSERQKVVVALRAVLGAVPVFTQGLTQPFLVEGDAGPAKAKFEELSKLIKALLPQWQTELKNLEAFEGIFFDILPNVPGYLQKWREYSRFDSSVGYVAESGTWFVGVPGGLNL
jgi:hypothetical protein